MDTIREKVSKTKSDENQQGLFATGDLKKTEASSFISISNVQEFSDDELESLERQLLGFSLSAKPISEIIGALEFQSTHKIYEIISSEVHVGNVKLAAIVSSIRVITTRKTGAEMAFVKLDDGTATIEAVVFPKIFKDTRDFWNEGTPLLVSGKIDFRDETPGLIIEAIETISKMGDKKKREVFINIPAESNLNCLKRLKTLLIENLGDQDAYLVFDKEKKVKLPFKIYWNEQLAQKINDIYSNQSS